MNFKEWIMWVQRVQPNLDQPKFKKPRSTARAFVGVPTCLKAFLKKILTSSSIKTFWYSKDATDLLHTLEKNSTRFPFQILKHRHSAVLPPAECFLNFAAYAR